MSAINVIRINVRIVFHHPGFFCQVKSCWKHTTKWCHRFISKEYYTPNICRTDFITFLCVCASCLGIFNLHFFPLEKHCRVVCIVLFLDGTVFYGKGHQTTATLIHDTRVKKDPYLRLLRHYTHTHQIFSLTPSITYYWCMTAVCTNNILLHRHPK